MPTNRGMELKIKEKLDWLREQDKQSSNVRYKHQPQKKSAV